MKYCILLLMILCSSFFCQSQMLVKVSFYHQQKNTHRANTIYYTVDSDRITSYFKNAEILRTDSLLTIWGTPILSSMICDCKSYNANYFVSIESFFKKNEKYQYSIKHKLDSVRNIKIDFLSVKDFLYCETRMCSRYFIAPANFEKGVILKCSPVVISSRSGDKQFVDSLEGLLKR